MHIGKVKIYFHIIRTILDRFQGYCIKAANKNFSKIKKKHFSYVELHLFPERTLFAESQCLIL